MAIHPISGRTAFYGQCAILSSLILYALFSERFPIIPAVACAFFLGTLSSQYICCRITHVVFSPLSAMITACSLTLLMRTHSVSLAFGAGFLAIASKFIIRPGGSHIFNPANIVLALIPLWFPAWISPGQWGQDVLIVLLLSCAGMVVTGGVKRMESALVFLSGYVVFIICRALYLGDPLTIPMHQLQNAGLILFAFFMLPDPATTPKNRRDNIIFALTVLTVTLVLQFIYTVPAAFIYALASVCAARGVWIMLRDSHLLFTPVNRVFSK